MKTTHAKTIKGQYNGRSEREVKKENDENIWLVGIQMTHWCQKDARRNGGKMGRGRMWLVGYWPRTRESVQRSVCLQIESAITMALVGLAACRCRGPNECGVNNVFGSTTHREIELWRKWKTRKIMRPMRAKTIADEWMDDRLVAIADCILIE